MKQDNLSIQRERDKVFLEFPVLQTERFILKKMDETFFEPLVSLFSDKSVTKYSGSEITDVNKHVEFYMKKVDTMYSNRRGIRWAVVDKETNDFVGDVGLYNIDLYSNNTEIGYSVVKSYWRQGVATECIKEVENFAFNRLNMNRIIAMIDKNNTPSIKLVEKLGFFRDGVLREHYYNSLNNEYISICVYSIIKKDRTNTIS